jgi:hypothetical protein
VSGREKWMPSARDLRHAINGLDCDPHEAVEAMLHKTGVRAQIAALDEVALNSPCAECVSYECVKAKLAALRKELA